MKFAIILEYILLSLIQTQNVVSTSFSLEDIFGKGCCGISTPDEPEMSGPKPIDQNQISTKKWGKDEFGQMIEKATNSNTLRLISEVHRRNIEMDAKGFFNSPNDTGTIY